MAISAQAPGFSRFLPGRWGESPTGSYRLLGALLGGMVELLLLPRLLLFAQFAGGLITWPWQLDYDEGVNLHAAWLLAQGQNIYLPNPPAQFISAPYPPVLYLLSAPLLWLGGLHLAAPRLLVLGAALVIAGLLVHLARQAGAPWPGAALPGMLWLATSPVILWAAVYKQDLPALACGLAGLAVLARAPDARRARILAAVLFTLAFFTKQSALAPAAAAVAWLFLRDRRAGLRFAGLLALTLGGGFGALLALSRGGFWEHAIVYQTYPWLLRFWQRLIGRLAGEYWPLLTLGLLAAVWATRNPRHSAFRLPPSAFRLPHVSLPVLYALAATGSVMIQAGYAGANYNHLLDLFPPLCWLVGVALGGLRGATGRRGGLALASVFVLLGGQALTLGGLENWYSAGYWPSPVRAGELSGRSALVRQTTGPIYAEDATLLLLNGRDPLYDDPDTIATMGDSGGWDEGRLVQDLRDRRFPLVLLRHTAWRWSARAGAAFDDSYELTFPGTLDVYRPRIYPTHAQVTLDCSLGAPAELHLTGYSLGPGVAGAGTAAGSDLRLALYWRALRPAGDYATFVHLLDAAGHSVAARDNPHSAAGRPTSAWPVGADLTEQTDLPLPGTLPPGRYHLLAGVYSTAGGQFHAVAVACPAAARRVGDAVDLGAVMVR